MRIVGTPQSTLSQPPATPEEAWRRGRMLDAMLPLAASNQPPWKPCVLRLTHTQRNALDDARMLAVARRLNAP